MSQLNQDLYDFIIGNKTKITDEWLASQLLEDPTYTSTQTEAYIREENGALIEAISSVYVQEKDEYREYINKRASKVAEKRAKEAFPVYESIRGFSNARKVYWNFIQNFIKVTDKSVTVEDISSWAHNMNTAFDYIIQKFAKLHYEHTQHRLTYQQDLISELSSPVIPIKEGIGVLPLIGNIDYQRADLIIESTLKQCIEKELSTIFIDLSAVPVLDTTVAQKLYQLLSALKLIGVDSIFSGIRPELARTAITLGADFSKVKTYSTLSQALEANSN